MLKQGLSVLKQGISALKQGISALKQGISVLKQGYITLKPTLLLSGMNMRDTPGICPILSQVSHGTMG